MQLKIETAVDVWALMMKHLPPQSDVTVTDWIVWQSLNSAITPCCCCYALGLLLTLLVFVSLWCSRWWCLEGTGINGSLSGKRYWHLEVPWPLHWGHSGCASNLSVVAFVHWCWRHVCGYDHRLDLFFFSVSGTTRSTLFCGEWSKHKNDMIVPVVSRKKIQWKKSCWFCGSFLLSVVNCVHTHLTEQASISYICTMLVHILFWWCRSNSRFVGSKVPLCCDGFVLGHKCLKQPHTEKLKAKLINITI